MALLKINGTDESLCNSVAELVHKVMSEPIKENPVAIVLVGTHYPSKFTNELLDGKHALGTVYPKHVLGDLDENYFSYFNSK